MSKVYVAGPLFNAHERWYLERISEALEQAGFQTYLPHRDAGILNDLSDGARKGIFSADLDALNECDFCVALLTGADHDSGTSLELGYLYARNKPCFGITDDKRWMNIMIWGVCSEGKHIVSRIEDLIPLINKAVPG